MVRMYPKLSRMPINARKQPRRECCYKNEVVCSLDFGKMGFTYVSFHKLTMCLDLPKDASLCFSRAIIELIAAN